MRPSRTRRATRAAGKRPGRRGRSSASGSPSAPTRIATSSISCSLRTQARSRTASPHRIARGVDRYLNIVRTGSRSQKPSGGILDTGRPKTEIVTGAKLKAAGISTDGEPVAPEQEVVITRFAPVKKGQSVRLRLSETYTAPQSYRLDGDELVFDRSLGRSRNAVVLPRGWYLTWLSIPAVLRQTPDGLTRIDFVNGRPDAIDVLIRARRLAPVH
jgi:hypothetical protein